MNDSFDCSLAKTCKGGFECCGLFPFNKSLLEKHIINQKYIVKINILEELVLVETTDNNCVFMSRDNGKCLIYEDRPKICRLYGKVDGLLCGYLRPDGSVRSRADRRQVQRKTVLITQQRLDYFRKECKKPHENLENNSQWKKMVDFVS